MKNVICLLGSPRRNGNSATLAKRFCETAESLGARVRIVELNTLHYRGCQACMSCKGRTETCVLADDLTEVLHEVAESDIVVMASPVYYGDVTAQLKAFIDRTFCYLVPDYVTNPQRSRLKGGKSLVFVQVQGNPDAQMFDDVYPRYERFFRFFGFDDNRLIRACGTVASGSLAPDCEPMRQAGQAARSLLGPIGSE